MNKTIPVPREWLERLVKHAEACNRSDANLQIEAFKLIGFAESAKYLLELK